MPEQGSVFPRPLDFESFQNTGGVERRSRLLQDLSSRFEDGIHQRLGSEFYIYPLDPGVGKTTALVNFLRSYKADGFLPDNGVIVFLNTKDQIRDIVAASGLGHNDFACLTVDSEINALGRGSINRAHAPILFTTQQKLGFQKAVNFSDMNDYFYKGKPRSLRVWDETFLPMRGIALRTDLIATLPAPLRRPEPEYIKVIDALLGDINNATDGERVTIPPSLGTKTFSYGSGGNRNPYALTKDQLAAANDLREMAGHGMIVRCGNDGDISLVGATSIAPADLAPLIVLDASARVLADYRLLAARQANIALMPAVANDYSPMDLNLWKRAASKSALGEQAVRKDVASAIAGLIDKKEGPWLVVMPLGNDSNGHSPQTGHPLEAEINRHLTVVNTVSYATWGQHRATNAYKDYRNVVIVGAFNRPDFAIEAATIAAKDGQANAEDIRAVKLGMTADALLQAACRGNARNAVDGKCGECSVYVIDLGSMVPEALTLAFPGATINEWKPTRRELRGDNRRLYESLKQTFSDPNVFSVSKKTITLSAGVSPSNLKRLVIRLHIDGWLRDLGVESSHHTFRRMGYSK